MSQRHPLVASLAMTTLSLAVACGPAPHVEAPEAEARPASSTTSTPPVASAPAAAPSASIAAVSSASAPAAKRAARPAKQAPATVWGALFTTPPAWLFVDARAVRASRAWPLVKQAVAQLDQRGRVAAIDKECGFVVLDEVDELLVAGDPDGPDPRPLVVARSRRGVDAMQRCFAALPRPPVTGQIEGARALTLGDELAVAELDGLVVAGHPAAVGRAVANLRDRGEALVQPPSWAAAASPLAALDARLGPRGPFASARATLASPPSGLRLSVGVEARDEASARAIVDEVKKGPAKLRDELGNAARKQPLMGQVDLVARSIDARASGARVEVAVASGGDDEAYLRAIEATLRAGFERYVLRSKSAEARRGVITIVMGLVSHASQHGKLPPSAPRTPARVPRGDTFTPDAATFKHPTWAAVQFQPSEPLRYSYSITTSRDGKRATVRAEGDLDGNGKLSRFEADVDFGNADGLARPSPLRETAPLE